jgi:hypothetical protein
MFERKAGNRLRIQFGVGFVSINRFMLGTVIAKQAFNVGHLSDCPDVSDEQG